MEKFIRELRAAKKRGVNVDDVFASEQERLMLYRIKMFGVGFSIVWSLSAPILVILLKFFCVANNIEHAWIPVDVTYWLCGISLLSMIAFAFNLIDLNDFMPRLPFRNRDENPKPELDYLFMPDHHTDDSDGDV